MGGPHTQGAPRVCEFAIDGLRNVLEGKDGFVYYERDGLNAVVSGPAGSGKTLLVLQMAATASVVVRDQGEPAGVRRRMNVLFLSKDTPPETVVWHACNDFNLFGEIDETKRPRGGWAFPPRRVLWAERQGMSAPHVEDEPEAHRAWLGQHIREFCTLRVPLKNGSGLVFVFLDRVVEAVEHAGLEARDQESCIASCLQCEEPVFAVGSFTLATGPLPRYHEDVFKGPLLGSLGRICGRLRPVFDWIEDGKSMRVEGSSQRWASDLFVVLDSLPSRMLRECLRAQAERPGTPEGEAKFTRPVAFYVSESPELPESLVASFPPDVQLKLGFRSEAHDYRTRTLQVLKARYQAARTEQFPLVVLDTSQCLVGKSIVLNVATPEVESHESKSPEPSRFKMRTPGITILPSLMDVPTCHDDTPKRQTMEVRFGNEELDHLTVGGHLSGGGCTLVVTENRCNSGPLGLHFLLGEIAQHSAARDRAALSEHRDAVEKKRLGVDLPRSVLYLAIDEDLPGVLHDIWRYPDLRSAIWEPGTDAQAIWPNLTQEISKSRESRALHWLYKIPLRHGDCPRPQPSDGAHQPRSPYLYVFTPDLVWCCQEEVLERISQILHYERHEDCQHKDPSLPPDEGFRGCCLAVDRVLFNRVSRVETRWPLIRDANVFVSCLAQVCRARLIELMIIDDTATQSPTSGHIASHWVSVAQNIIRLKRVPFHGTEAVAMEFVRSHGASPRVNRPLELRSELEGQERQGAEQAWRLRVKDSFRGYTALFTGNPRRCRVKVDLPYDRRETPLYRDMMNTKWNLEALIDGADVNVVGPEERPGVNSALSNLAHVGHDTCHVAAIDEIWIHRIIGDDPKGAPAPNPDPGLAQLSLQEVGRALSEHAKGYLPEAASLTFHDVKEHYVTEALTIACKKAGRPEAIYALPFRHNWGCLAIAQPRCDAIRSMADGLARKLSMEANDLKKLLAEDKLLQQLGGDSFRGLVGVLVNCDGYLARVKALKLRRVCRAVRSLIWDIEGRQKSITWQMLVDFKKDVWDAVVRQGGFHDLLRSENASSKGESESPSMSLAQRLAQWFRRTTHVRFFDFDRGTSESVVSFLIELLLAHCDWNDLFLEAREGGTTKETYATASLLFLRTDQEEQELDRMANAVMVMYRLLSPRLRRELAVGPAQRFSGGPAHTAKETKQEDHQKRQARSESAPDVYTLISREWLSTVPELGPHSDLREQIVRKHLLPAEKDPNAAGTRLRRVICEPGEPTAARDEALRDACRGKGATVSGTWYLGALSGGNVDVATDVIRELVSEYHERDRMITGSSAPVKRRFYSPSSADDQGADHAPARFEAPYADIMGIVYPHERRKPSKSGREAEEQPREPHRESRQIPTFPFCRARIREYTTISLELASLVRQVMQLDERQFPEEEQLREAVKQLLRRTLHAVRQTYLSRGHPVRVGASPHPSA